MRCSDAETRCVPIKTAVYPGSFDPVTLGHLDILERAAVVFDEVIVVVMQNRRKNYWFTKEERCDFLRRSASYIKNVTVDSSDMLLADYCKKKGAVVIVKGLRAVSDFELEFQMALMNRKLNHDLDTMFLTSSEKFQYLSSSVVKEVSMFGGDICEFVPPEIENDIKLHKENRL